MENTGFTVKKLRGWEKILAVAKEAKEKILGAPHYLLEKERAFLFKSAVSPLAMECDFREDELFPKNKIDLVVNAVIEVASLAPVWYNEFTDFIRSQAGEERVVRFLQENPDWTISCCPCGHPDHQAICTLEFKRSMDERYALRSEMSSISDMISDILGTSGRTGGKSPLDDIDFSAIFGGIPGMRKGSSVGYADKLGSIFMVDPQIDFSSRRPGIPGGISLSDLIAKSSMSGNPGSIETFLERFLNLSKSEGEDAEPGPDPSLQGAFDSEVSEEQGV